MQLKQEIGLSGRAAGATGSRDVPRILFFCLSGPALFAVVTYAFGWVEVGAAPVWSTTGGFALSLMFTWLFVVMGETFIEDLVKLAFVLPLFWFDPDWVDLDLPWVHPIMTGLVCGGICGFLLNTCGLGDLRAKAGGTDGPERNRRRPSRAERHEDDDKRRRERREAEARAYRARLDEKNEADLPEKE